MDDFPLLHKRDAEQGIQGSAELHLRELAYRLRNDPTPTVCTAAAELFERAARGGAAKAAQALYLTTPHRPPQTERDNEIRERVYELLEQGMTLPDARKKLAERFELSLSRVKGLTQRIPFPIERIDADWVDSEPY